MTREEIIEKLLEPNSILTSEEFKEIDILSSKDSEVSELRAFNTEMSKLDETLLFGVPQSSDVEFLTTLRAKLDTGRASVTGYLGSWKLVGIAASVCAVLFFVVLSGGITGSGQHYSLGNPEMLARLDEIQLQDVLTDTEGQLDPDSLAEFLGVSQEITNIYVKDNSELPLTDQLLALYPSDLDVVLGNVELMNFF
jgi:hypothetical protein